MTYRYRFAGEVETTFSSISLSDPDTGAHRTLVCQPGDTVDLDDPVTHPDLAPANAAAKKAARGTPDDTPAESPDGLEEPTDPPADAADTPKE